VKSRCSDSKAVTVHGKGLDFTRVTKQDVHTESTPRVLAMVHIYGHHREVAWKVAQRAIVQRDAFCI